MNEKFQLKYQKILDIMPDIAECANKELILIGGTALSIFHLKHRISVDLDFIPLKINGDTDVRLKERLKGCISKKGYRAQRSAYTNQFTIQFEETSIKVEIFIPEYKVKKIESYPYGVSSEILVASMDDLFVMKLISYKDRVEARDLFDIYCMLRNRSADYAKIKELIRDCGPPKNLEEIEGMVIEKNDYLSFKKVVEDASKTGN